MQRVTFLRLMLAGFASAPSLVSAAVDDAEIKLNLDPKSNR